MGSFVPCLSALCFPSLWSLVHILKFSSADLKFTKRTHVFSFVNRVHFHCLLTFLSRAAIFIRSTPFSNTDFLLFQTFSAASSNNANLNAPLLQFQLRCCLMWLMLSVIVDHENSFYSVSTLERRRPKSDKHRRHSGGAGGRITGVQSW